jgi:hypothetical protein
MGIGAPQTQIFRYFLESGMKRGITGDPRATSGPRPLKTVPSKLFVNFLLDATRSLIYSEGFEK